MANYIKIPLAINPARAMIAGNEIDPTRLTGGGSVDGGAAGLSSSTVESISTGSGTGAEFDGSTGGIAGPALISDITLTIQDGGSDYSVGDVITVSKATLGTETTWDVAITFTVVESDLVAYTGSSTDEYQMIPIDNVMSVGATSGVSGYIETNEWDATAGATFRWTLTMDNSPATTGPHLTADLAAAVNKASQAENSQPTVEFLYAAECLSVVYGVTPP